MISAARSTGAASVRSGSGRAPSPRASTPGRTGARARAPGSSSAGTAPTPRATISGWLDGARSSVTTTCSCVSSRPRPIARSGSSSTRRRRWVTAARARPGRSSAWRRSSPPRSRGSRSRAGTRSGCRTSADRRTRARCRSGRPRGLRAGRRRAREPVGRGRRDARSGLARQRARRDRARRPARLDRRPPERPDRSAAGRASAIATITTRGSVLVVVQVLDPDEDDFPFDGDGSSPGARGRRLGRDRRGARANAYLAALAEERARWRQMLVGRGAKFLSPHDRGRSGLGGSLDRGGGALSFLTILALGIAVLVAAPYFAHRLRRQRADQVPFAPVRLVPRRRRRRGAASRLEDRSLFAIRGASVIALALLGASPLVRCSRLALSRGGASVAIAIVLDDSMSMRATDGGERSRFARAKKGAEDILASLRDGDAAAIVLAGAPARVGLAATTDIGAARAALEAVTESDRATDLDGALAIGRDAASRELPQIDRRVVVLSDSRRRQAGRAAARRERCRRAVRSPGLGRDAGPRRGEPLRAGRLRLRDPLGRSDRGPGPGPLRLLDRGRDRRTRGPRRRRLGIRTRSSARRRSRRPRSARRWSRSAPTTRESSTRSSRARTRSRRTTALSSSSSPARPRSPSSETGPTTR